MFDYGFAPDGGHRPYFLTRPVATWLNQHREGGTIALGKNVPNIPREKLNVLPESEWQTQKELFALESWYNRLPGNSGVK